MIIAKINEEVVGSIFGPSGRVLRELENRYKLNVDAHKLSDDRKFRLISITGNIINTCGFLYEIGELVGSANIIISPKIAGHVYVYAQSLLNPINSNGSRPPASSVPSSTVAVPKSGNVNLIDLETSIIVKKHDSASSDSEF
ncbi:hypothetical protein ACKWTF_002807 [Chironomus riparius]